MVDQSLIEEPRTTNSTLEVFPTKDRSVRNHTCGPLEPFVYRVDERHLNVEGGHEW